MMELCKPVKSHCFAMLFSLLFFVSIHAADTQADKNPADKTVIPDKDTAVKKETTPNNALSASRDAVIKKNSAINKSIATGKDSTVIRDTANNKKMAINTDTTAKKDTASNESAAVAKDSAIAKDTANIKTIAAATDTAGKKDTTGNKPAIACKDTTPRDFADFRSLSFGAFPTKKNPALLGFRRTVRTELIAPVFPAMEAGYWSNKLALPLYINAADSGKLADYIDIVLDRSFQTAGLDPARASDRILSETPNGASICARMRTTPMALAAKIGSFTVQSNVDAQVNIPRAFFAVIFGDDQGLTPGSSFDFTGLKAEAVAYSTISASYGRQFSSLPLQRLLNRFSRGFLDFNQFSWGVGLDYVLGHALFRERTLSGSMKVINRNNIDAVAIDGQVEMVTAGGGFHGKWKAPEDFNTGFFFPGNGVGLSAGVALSGPRASLDLSLNNLGFIRWHDVKKVIYTVKDTAAQLPRLLSDTIVRVKPGKGDTLKNASVLYQSLPTNLSLATGYTFLFNDQPKKVRAYFQYTTIAFQIEQNCAPWPTRSYVPRVGVGVEDGAAYGFVPLRCGFFAGGGEYYGSSLGVGLNTRFIKIDLGYTAYGSVYFYTRRGMALSANIMGRW